MIKFDVFEFAELNRKIEAGYLSVIKQDYLSDTTNLADEIYDIKYDSNYFLRVFIIRENLFISSFEIKDNIITITQCGTYNTSDLVITNFLNNVRIYCV